MVRNCEKNYGLSNHGEDCEGRAHLAWVVAGGFSPCEMSWDFGLEHGPQQVQEKNTRGPTPGQTLRRRTAGTHADELERQLGHRR